MNKTEVKVGIIGGGLAGVYTAYLLEQHNIPYQLIEAKAALGGRIYGESTRSNDYNIDLGPSWIFPHQQQIQGLVGELGLQLVEQFSEGDAIFQRNAHEKPQQLSGVAPPPMYRIQGGTTKLIEALSESLNKDSLSLSSNVKSLQFDGQVWQVIGEKNIQDCGTRDVDAQPSVNGPNLPSTMLSASSAEQSNEHKSTPSDNCASEGYFDSSFDSSFDNTFTHLVIAAPPRIIANTLSYTLASMEQPDSLLAILRSKSASTPTWMAAQAKFAITYERPFWRDHGLSGQAFSHVGPMGEIHDASFDNNSGDSVYALFGFIGIPFTHRQQVSEDEIKQVCVNQLTVLFGEQARAYVELYYKDWGNDVFTANALDQQQASAHPHINLNEQQAQLQQAHLYLATSEFAASEAGYMEGAIVAAHKAVNDLRVNLDTQSMQFN